MRKIEHLLTVAPERPENPERELMTASVSQARLGSRGQHQLQPTASRERSHERAASVEKGQLELFDTRYYHWGINE
jgi:hypothetical protein